MDPRLSALDVTLGATITAVRFVGTATQTTMDAARQTLDPLVRLAQWRPAPESWRPSRRSVEPLAAEGAAARKALTGRLGALLDDLVPAVLGEVLSRARVTDLVLTYVDLDAVAAAVDLDRAVERVDLEAILDRVDVDAVVAKVDLEAILERVDVDAVVAKVDLDAILDRVDLDAVAARLDIGRVLDRMDLTSVVLERVDLDVLTQAVLARVDLIDLAEQVIEGVDLPEIIRESTGAMASDTVQGVRMHGIAADDAISHAMDRFRLRHRRHGSGEPQEALRPEGASEDVSGPLGVRVP